jgi:hypothetical protein
MDEMAKLRQTVTNATSWQFRTNAPQRPEEPKKTEPEYLDVKKEFKSKFASKQHSRNNSRTEDVFVLEQLPIERPPPAKTPTKVTPRVSQDKIIASKDRSMSKTDPLGSFATLSLTKKTTSCRPADLRI